MDTSFLIWMPLTLAILIAALTFALVVRIKPKPGQVTRSWLEYEIDRLHMEIRILELQLAAEIRDAETRARQQRKPPNAA